LHGHPLALKIRQKSFIFQGLQKIRLSIADTIFSLISVAGQAKPADRMKWEAAG
jgi:hypothetical protein